MEFSLVHMWQAMGIVAKCVVYVLLIMSIGTLTIAIERLIAFARAAGQSQKFALENRQHLADRAFGAVAERQRSYKNSPLAQVVGTGVAEYEHGLAERAKGASYDVVDAAQRAAERAIDGELARMRRGFAVLATVGSTAPFVGLFGTVFGIINAFQSMGQGQGDLATVGPGIAEALVTTAFGILVAVIGVWFYNLFTARVDSLSNALTTSKNEIVDFFIKDEGRAGAKAAA
jgi:biopolymer transport protein ExbB/TolQ